MFSSLRMRLIGSYIFILVLTLVVIGVALLVVLRARPVSTDEINSRLANQLELIGNRKDLSNLSADGLYRLFSAPLKARQIGVRIITTNGNGLVVYDSQRTLKL